MAKPLASLEGMAELKALLKDTAPRVAKNVLRSTTHAVAKVARDRIRAEAPVRSGKLKRGIKHKRGKMTAGSPEVFAEVFADTGAFHWRFVNNGTVAQAANPFVDRAMADLTPELPGLYRTLFGQQFEKTMAREAKKRARR